MNLLPCPFCGSTGGDIQYGTKDREGTPVNIICEGCGACGPWVYASATTNRSAEPVAIEAWNRRAPVTAPVAMD